MNLNIIKENREKMGITQMELAKKVNKSYKTIQAIEQGRRKPGRVLTIQLFKILKIPMSKLEFFLQEQPTKC